MKQIWYRLYKTPLFWALCAVTIGYVLVLSERYYNSSYGPAFYWDCYLTSYDTPQELLEQKSAIEEHLTWLREEAAAFADSDELEEELRLTIKTIDVMDFLLERGLAYNDVCEGTFYGAGACDRRAYNGYISEKCMFYQGFASVVLLLLIVTMSRSNGTCTNDILRYGRERLYFNELGTFFITQIILFSCQFVSAWIIRYQFVQIGREYLYYYSGKCHLFSPDLVQLAEWGQTFMLLLLGWTILFAVAELLNRSVIYLIVGFVLAYGFRNALTDFTQQTYERWLTIWPAYRVYGVSDFWYAIKHVIWLLIGMITLIISWVFVRRRNCKLKYE